MNSLASQSTVSSDLCHRYQQLKQQQPKLRARNAAAALNVSEAELLACRADLQATRLQADWPAILKQVAEIGDVMALTRNEYAVHERRGAYEKPVVLR